MDTKSLITRVVAENIHKQANLGGAFAVSWILLLASPSLEAQSAKPSAS